MAQPLQQDDNYKQFMSWITTGGLRYASAKQHGLSDADATPLFRAKVDHQKKHNIIVVGAGMSGLAAAYELAQIGHEVTILEMNSRVGGRVKTLREGFQDGLHCEGGAMRIPYNHYLTKHYIDQFSIPTRKFQNYQENGYMYIFGDKIRMKEFIDNNGKYSDLYWPGWDANLTDTLKQSHNIKGILDYIGRTVDPVRNDLGQSPTEQDWQAWISKWSVLSVEDFLRGTKNLSPSDPQLRPWPEAAVNGLKSFTYTVSLSVDLVWLMRDGVGQYGTNVYTPTAGMDALPKAFTKQNNGGWNNDVDLSKNIIFGCRVGKVELRGDHPDLGMKQVRVTGVNMFTGATEEYDGDAVILTVPLQILRQMDVPLGIPQQKAIANITYGPSTKIMLQCRSRFWQKDVGQGGFSKSNLMIGQLHYPDYDGSGIADDERGILLVYTWYDNALAFGSETPAQAIKEAVKEISKIHPEIETEFEVGQVQNWNNDPSSQGAFTSLKPYEFMDSMKTLKRPVPPIYLAGEAISWSNGWIQGALYSGLLQAFLFQARAEGYGDVDPMTMLNNMNVHP